MKNQTLSLLITPMTGNGGDRVVINLARMFVALGVKVDMIVPEVTEYHQKMMPVLAGVRTIDLGLPISRTIYLKKLIKLKRYLEQENPAVLLANGDYAGLSNLAQLISRCTTKIVQVVHVNVSHYLSESTGIKGAMKSFLLKQFYRQSDGIVTVSQGVAEDLASFSGIPSSKIQVIYNPVVTDELAVKAQEPVAHPWFAPGEPPVILGAGRLMYQKDFATLIRAFAKVRSQRACRLVIIGGDAVQKQELEALIHELELEQDAQLAGFADNPYAFMANAAVFALSSRYEGFGNVLVEAMATGTPVVSTDCKDGPAEILENGKYGRLAPVENSGALADAILATLDDPIDSEILQRRAQEFTDRAIAQQYLNFIQEKILLS